MGCGVSHRAAGRALAVGDELPPASVPSETRGQVPKIKVPVSMRRTDESSCVPVS